ncbi:MAG TPA: methyltransferase domain-containing protein [Acidimicrobiales bacterium]|nr:methyltransferase domain-containing protein [Acidimicrobiales bacterium]
MSSANHDPGSLFSAADRVGPDPVFRSDLYIGTGDDYERFRPPYPQPLIRELVERASLSGGGRLLDLACGTGQIAFALSGHFDEVWAVDQEPDMIRVGASKARTLAVGHICWLLSRAEDLIAPSRAFQLVTLGNAFHRLPRGLIAGKAFAWLVPGGFIALLWGGSPTEEATPWQRALAETVELWVERLGAGDRVPTGWHQARTSRPDLEVLKQAGFEPVGRFSAAVERDWTLESLAGFVYSSSALPRAVIGDRVTEFEADLRTRLRQAADDGPYRQSTEFACDLAQRPPEEP